MRRFFCETITAATATITGDDAHHITRVLRLKAGDALSLTLKLRTADGKAVTQTVSVPVQAHMMMPAAGGGAGASAPMMPGAGGHHHHGMAH